MGILNERFDFHRDARPDQIHAFVGTPVRILVLPGQRLFRFFTARTNAVFGSPWWIPAESRSRILAAAGRTGATLPKVARPGLAVTTGFSPTMGYFCEIEMMRPAHAWRGVASGQPDPKAPGGRLPGGLEQLFLPNLGGPESDSPQHGLRSDFARLLTVCSVE